MNVSSASSLSIPHADVVVIGGGSAGLGVARAAAERGLSVVVLERGECGRATSDNSLRIIHGGFRYLQTFHLTRVIESLRAQAALRSEFPEIVKPLPCLMPLEAHGLKSRWPVRGAQVLFRAIARSVVGDAPLLGIMERDEVEREVPILAGRAPHGALLWTDAVMTDSKALLSAWTARAQEKGAVVRERIDVRAMEDRGDSAVVTLAGGEQLLARWVVNAAGPEIDAIERPDGRLRPAVAGWARAFNVIVRPQLESHYGVALPGDGRLLFAVPRGEHTAIGTGYLPERQRGERSIAESEVAAFLIEASRTLPEPLTLSDVVAVEAGLLPMAGLKDGAPVLCGAERIEREGRIITVISTKYTTFAEQGKKVARLLRA